MCHYKPHEERSIGQVYSQSVSLLSPWRVVHSTGVFTECVITSLMKSSPQDRCIHRVCHHRTGVFTECVFTHPAESSPRDRCFHDACHYRPEVCHFRPCEERSTGQKFALKCVLDSPRSRQETCIHQLVTGHPHIVSLYRVYHNTIRLEGDATPR